MHNELDDHSVDEDNEEFVRRTIIDGCYCPARRQDEGNSRHENEQDTPLMFRRFACELLAKLRLKLLGAINDDDILLQDVPGSISRGELLERYLFDDVFFRVKKAEVLRLDAIRFSGVLTNKLPALFHSCTSRTTQN
jgi:hypothetical protein